MTLRSLCSPLATLTAPDSSPHLPGYSVCCCAFVCIAVPGYSVCCCAFVCIAVPLCIAVPGYSVCCCTFVCIAVPFFCMNQQTEDDACICCGAAVSTGCPHQLSQVCLKLGYDKVCTCVWYCRLNILCACIF